MPGDEGKAGEFSTAAFGFRKADVLAYIDALAAESLEKEAEHTAQLETMQASMDALEQDKNTLLTKTKEICDDLTAQRKRAEAAEAAGQDLRGQLLRAREASDGYKGRLIAQEQELMALRSENHTLKEQLEEAAQKQQATQQQMEEHQKQATALVEEARNVVCQKQEAMSRQLCEAQQHVQEARDEAARQKAEAEAQLQAEQQAALQKLHDAQEQAARQKAELQRRLEEERQQADRRIAAALAEASEQVAAAQAQARQEEQRSKERICSGAQELDESIRQLREKLAAVDAQIAGAVGQLQQVTAAVHTALDGTEAELRGLGVQMRDFPNGRACKRLPAEPRPVQTQKPAPAAPAKPGRTALSDSLLDRLAGMMRGDK